MIQIVSYELSESTTADECRDTLQFAHCLMKTLRDCIQEVRKIKKHLIITNDQNNYQTSIDNIQTLIKQARESIVELVDIIHNKTIFEEISSKYKGLKQEMENEKQRSVEEEISMFLKINWEI